MASATVEQMSELKTFEMMKCSLCNEFCERSKIRQHLMEHFSGSDSSSRHICDQCGESFRAYHLLINHSLNHGTPKFPCDSCQYKGSTKGNLKRHIDAVHTKDSVRRCDVCFEGFADQRGLIKHMMNKHGLEHKFKCEKCNKIFLTEQRFLLHTPEVCDKKKTAEITRHACDRCDYKANALVTLKRHKQAVHDKVFHCCETCGFRTLWKRTLNDHVMHVHGNRAKSYPCGLCDYSSPRITNLKAHAESVHLKMREECCICGHIASNKSNIRKHMIMAHNGVKNETRTVFKTDLNDAKSSVLNDSNDTKGSVQDVLNDNKICAKNGSNHTRWSVEDILKPEIDNRNRSNVSNTISGA